MIITIKNTRLKTEKTFYSWKEVERAFECDTFYEHYTLRSEYNAWVEDIKTCDCYASEEGKAEELDYALNEYPNKVEIIDDEVEYYTEMVEYETWCSPRGVESVYKIVSIEE
jgi:hypothetical protein